jgi:hypothetical protein
VELIHDRIVGVVRDARDSRRARLARQQEREAAAKKAQEELERAQRDREAAEQKAQQVLERMQHDREVAEQKAQLELERVQREREAAEQARKVELERERSANEVVQRKKAERSLRNVTLALGAAVVATGLAGYFGWRSSNEADRVDDINETLNKNLEDAKKSRDTLADELNKTRLELAQLKVDAAKGADAKAQAERAAEEERRKVTAEAAARQAVTSGSSLKISDWRLTSGACNKGEVTLTGEATFTVAINGDNVEIRQAFAPAPGKGFAVKINNPAQTLPRAKGAKAGEFYDIQTDAEWAGRGQSFKTSSVERVFLNTRGEPVKAFLIRIRTQCS